MRKYIKLFLLSFAFVLMTGTGDTVKAQDPEEKIYTITETYENPLYDEDYVQNISEEEKAQTADAWGELPSEIGKDSEEEEIEENPQEKMAREIAEKIRDAMVNRRSDVSFTYINSTGYDKKDLQTWFEMALAETDNSEEGDYLRWNYEKYNASISYYKLEDSYYFEYEMVITYYTTAHQEDELNHEIERTLASLGVDNYDLSDYEKTKRIYDYICENVTYDHETLYDDSYKLKYTAYAAMIHKTAVCQGYATLMYRMLEECDIDTRVIYGVSFGENHAWNIINLGSVYYLADSTWDAGQYDYDYFLNSENNFANHDAKSEFLPEYPLADEDYFPVNVYLDKKAISLKWGESERLNVTVESQKNFTVQWTSSDEEVATVDRYGIIRAKGDGEAIIKAAVPGDKATCKVAVTHDHIGRTTIKAVEPTCIEEGCTEEVTCYLCQEILIASQVVKATGHNYVKYVCTVCGKNKPYSKFTYKSTPLYMDYTGKAVSVTEKHLDLSKANPKFKAEYYLDKACKTPTYKGNNKKVKKAPTNIGTYYVKIICPENDDYRYKESKTPLKMIIRPRKVASLKAVNQSGSIKLTWGKRTEATGYIIYRKTADTEFAAIKTINNKSTVSYVDKNVSKGIKYFYNIVAYKTVSGQKIKSAKRQDNTGIVRTKITAVTNQNGSVKITWTKVPQAEGYKVYRKAADQKTYALIKKIDKASTVTYVDKTAKTIRNGKKCQYYIEAYYEKTSKVVLKTDVRTHCYVTRPAISSVKRRSSTSINVKWKKNSQVTGYQIRYSTSSSFKNAKIATVKSKNTVSKKITGLKRYKKYYVQVRTYKTINGKKYYSTWSAKKSA